MTQPAVAAAPRPPRPSDLMLEGKLRVRIGHGRALVRMAEAPTHVESGLLEIPEKYRDEPLEGVVVQTGGGRRYPEHYCRSFVYSPIEEGRSVDPGAFSDCGQLARFAARTVDGTRRLWLCADCAPGWHAAGILGWLLSGLQAERPLGFAVGDRVVVSGYAAKQNRTLVLGESLVLTDDVLAVIEPGTPMVIRAKAV